MQQRAYSRQHHEESVLDPRFAASCVWFRRRGQTAEEYEDGEISNAQAVDDKRGLHALPFLNQEASIHSHRSITTRTGSSSIPQSRSSII
jgi:hypothetical protein